MPAFRLWVDAVVDNEILGIDNLFVVKPLGPAEGRRDRDLLITSA